MAQLPIFQTKDQALMLLETKWASILNPVIGLPLNSPSMLQNVSVVAGSNVIDHRLGVTPQGWIVIDSNAVVTLYRSAPFNPLTLTLISSGTAVISLLVF